MKCFICGKTNCAFILWFIRELKHRTKLSRQVKVTIERAFTEATESLRRERHLSDQAASDNADWFNALCHDLGEKFLLPEKATPTAILTAVDQLKSHNGKMRETLDELWDYVGESHKPTCSIQDAEEPHCDCGYEQWYRRLESVVPAILSQTGQDVVSEDTKILNQLENLELTLTRGEHSRWRLDVFRFGNGFSNQGQFFGDTLRKVFTEALANERKT